MEIQVVRNVMYGDTDIVIFSIYEITGGGNNFQLW